MNAAQAEALRQLVESQPVAALGNAARRAAVRFDGAYAILPGGRLVIHVSGLAAHTRDRLANPAVSLLI